MAVLADREPTYAMPFMLGPWGQPRAGPGLSAPRQVSASVTICLTIVRECLFLERQGSLSVASNKKRTAAGEQTGHIHP